MSGLGTSIDFDPSDYEDEHLNLFAAYGGPRTWENNVTAAVAKFLRLSPPGVARSFLKGFLRVPTSADGQAFRVWLQRHDEEALPNHLFSAVLSAGGRVGPSDPTASSYSAKEPRPDLWVLADDGSYGALVETKLWGEDGRAQQQSQARRFGAKEIGARTFDELMAWLDALPPSTPMDRVLRDELRAYFEDLGLPSKFTGFTRRDFAEEKPGKFTHAWPLGPKVRSLCQQVADANDDILSAPIDANGFDGKKLYVEIPPKNRESVGYVALSVVATGVEENESPCFCAHVFVSGARSTMNLAHPGHRGFGAFLRGFDSRSGTAGSAALARLLGELPEKTCVTLKTYTLRVQAVVGQRYRAWWSARGDGKFSKGGSLSEIAISAEELANAILTMGRRLHACGEKRQYAALIFSGPEIPAQELVGDGKRVRNRIGAEMRIVAGWLARLNEALRRDKR